MSWLWICDDGWEQYLRDELARTLGPEGLHVVQPGWVRHDASPWPADAVPCVALAGQCLPDAVELEAPSISTWAQQAGELLVARLREHEGPWRLHTFSRYGAGDASGYRRGTLIRQALVDYLRRKQRRLLRTRNEDAAPWQEQEWLVQLAWRNATQGAISICTAQQRQQLRRVISRFTGGVAAVPDEPLAPSRAYRKLAEVQVRLSCAIQPIETCIDLGSSPGSWAWLALRAGARVTAIDRSPLRDDLMRHPRLEFIKRDAFTFTPAEPVDWLLSDVIAFPSRVLELLERWLTRGWCRRFCVTIKFRGPDEYARLEEFKELLSRQSADYCLRRLTYNRNEVTAYGYAAGEQAASDNLC